MKPKTASQPGTAFGRVRKNGFLAGLLLLAAACEPFPETPESPFKPPADPKPYSTAEALKQFDAAPDELYRLGQGDLVTILVWDRPDLSGPSTLGPDGVVTLPVSGPVSLSGLTREEAAKTIKDKLSRYYAEVNVAVRVDQYVSNRVIVLGKVRTPGVQRFDGQPTLVEAISRAGGILPEDRPWVNVTHCAVIRGRDRVAWLDLKSLLEAGDFSLNLRLRPNDIVFIPEWSDLPVYVLGQVTRPGPYRWTRGMTFLDAITMAGGSTRDAANSQIRLIRPSKNLQVVVSLGDVLEPTPGTNVTLERGDIVYVPSSLLADVGYFLEKVNPFGWVFLATGVR